MTSDEILTEAPMQTVVVDDLVAEPYVVTDGTVVVSLSGRDVRIELRMRSETARRMVDGITGHGDRCGSPERN